MLVTQRVWGSYSILNRDNGAIVWWDVDRDDAVCNAILEDGPIFWAQVENGPAPEILASLYLGEQKVGEVVVAADDEAGGAECLAVITVDALARSLTLADGRACDPLPLPYLLDQPA